MDNQSLTPKVIKEELDRYVIGQDDAKKAVAIALRNRWRRLNVKDETLRDPIFFEIHIDWDTDLIKPRRNTLCRRNRCYKSSF